MFPFLNEKKYNKQSLPDQINKPYNQAPSKMIDILSTINKANQQINKKTEKLIEIGNYFSNVSTNMLKVHEDISKYTVQNHKYIRRIDKKISQYGTDKNDNNLEKRQSQYPLFKNPSRTTLITAYGNTQNGKFYSKQIRENQNDDQFKGKKIYTESNTEQQTVSHLEIKEKNLEAVFKKQISHLRLKFQQIKSQISAINKFEIKSSINVDFKNLKRLFDSQQSIDLIKFKFQLSTWIGELYRTITDYCYLKYSNKIFGQSQTRLFFCQSIIINTLNVLTFVRKEDNKFWIKNRFTIIQFMKESERKILKFLKTKFPRNKKTFKSIEIENVIQKINNSEDPRYDIIKNTEIQFVEKQENKETDTTDHINLDQKIHYIKQIKIFFNALIREVNKTYKIFHQNIEKIFTGGNNLNKGNGKYLIGKKFKENIPEFTDQQLETFDFNCKSPEIIRILIKWLEQIEQFINNPEDAIMKKKAFKNINIKNKDAVPASEKVRRKIVEILKKEIESNKQWIGSKNQILTGLIDNISELVDSKPDNIEFLKQQDVKTIKFSQLVGATLPFFATDRIQLIIKIFRVLQKKTSNRLQQQIDLLNFSVFDLLRCRCKGTQEEIVRIYTQLKQSKYFELIRVKNRLDTPLNDILINCKISNSPIICQIQLSINNQYFDEKSLMNDHFNHFLYELQRSRFGPLCQACLIIKDSDPRMEYAPQLKKVKMFYNSLTQQQKQKINLRDEIKLCYNNHKLTLLDFRLPFICTLCSNFNQQFSSSFNSYQCKQCNLRICPCCLFQKIDQKKKLEIYFNIDPVFKYFQNQKYYQLKNFNKVRYPNLQSIILQILTKQNQKYCILVRFSQGKVTKRGYKLLSEKIVCPVFFYIKNQINIEKNYDRYDILLIPKKQHFEIKSFKQLKNYKQKEIVQSNLTLKVLESKALQLRKTMVTLIHNQNALLIDFNEDQSDENNIKEITFNNRIKQILYDCSVSKNTTLDINSRELTQLIIIYKEIDTLKHILTVVGDQNKITNISPLLKLPSVRKISMKNNLVSSINQIILSDQLVDLFLAYNQFQTFPQLKAKNMTRISFKHNKIKNLANLEKSELFNLIQLGLGENQIESIPKMNLPELQKLVLKQNKLKQISNLSNSNIPNIKVLNFEDNLLEHIPILQLKTLKNLILKKNKINNTHFLLDSKLPNLVSLNLSVNKICKFEINRFESLRILDLSYNEISSIEFIKPEFFPKLKQLNLNNNKIQKIGCINIQSLQKLDFSSNLINKLSTDEQMKNNFLMSNLPSLQYLYLFKNNNFYFDGLIMKEVRRKLKNIEHIT